MVKNSHWRMAETIFAALSLVYLNDCVTLFIFRSFSSSKVKRIRLCSPIGSKGEEVVRTRNMVPEGKIILPEIFYSVFFIMDSGDKISYCIGFAGYLPEHWCEPPGAHNKQEFS